MGRTHENMRLAVAVLLLGGAWAAPTPDKPVESYGAPAAPACPLQRGEGATGYGCEEGQECETKYEEKCSTSYDQQCETKYDQKCETKYENKCETQYSTECETLYEQKCKTEYDTKCETKYDTKCET